MSSVHLSDDVIYLYDGDFEMSGDPEVDVLTFEIGGDDVFLGEDEASYSAAGEGGFMTGTSRGGNDKFHAGAFTGTGSPFDFKSGAVFWGDGWEMSGHAVGGRDLMEAGINSTNFFMGDASDASESARGGNDTLIGGNAGSDAITKSEAQALIGGPGSDSSINFLLGDAYSFGGHTRLLRPVDFRLDQVQGGQDQVDGGDAVGGFSNAFAFNVLSGDAYAMYGLSRGGADKVTGGDARASDATLAISLNLMAGDAAFMSDGTLGGKDIMTGGDATAGDSDSLAVVLNLMIGDAFGMGDFTRAGNDTLLGGDADGAGGAGFGLGDAYAMNVMAGDTFDPGTDTTFGKDQLTGGDGSGGAAVINLMFGDVGSIDGLLSGPLPPIFFPPDTFSLLGKLPSDLTTAAIVDGGEHHYGNDTLTGGSGNSLNFMVGDAEVINSDSTGGNDVLVAGGSALETTMIGDAEFIADGGRGGNDKLYSGRGDDDMWGDAHSENDGRGGADRFIFSAKNGEDVIYDFSPRERDKIDLKAFKNLDTDFRNFAEFLKSGRIEQGDDQVILHLDVDDPTSDLNTVTLLGISASELTKSSFEF